MVNIIIIILEVLIVGILIAGMLQKGKENSFVEDLYLKRYQIQVYDADHKMLFFDNYEAFSFEEACKLAKEDFYKKYTTPGTKPTFYPIRFFHRKDPRY